MLHGCTQDPDLFAKATQMNTVAEREGFYVLYPEQPASAQQMKCWHWFDAAHQVRGQGEPALIAGMVGQVKERYEVDGRAVFVAGLSAGAAMSVVMGATYPDVFAAIGVASGLEYKAGTTQAEGQQAMNLGGPNPDAEGRAAYEAMGQAAQVVPVMVFHGTQDTTVKPINAGQILAQWAATDRLAAQGQPPVHAKPDMSETGKAPNGRSFTHQVYKNDAGTAILESYMVDGMAHAWSGGLRGGSYTDPQGPNASELLWGFFKSHRRS
jgi:poly(hydroxyalkanoate) depolymerase family esterase